MNVCEGCGAEVVMLPFESGDAPTVSSSVWGVPLPFERLMVRVGGLLGVQQHVCRDYVAWHQPADRRDPSAVDVPDGWQPRVVERVPA